MVALSRVLQFIGKHVEKHFRVACGVDVAAIELIKLFGKLFRIRQITVMREHDSVRRVDIERLRLFVA